MAFRNSQQARVYFGPLALSTYTRSVSTNGSLAMLDVTCLTDTDFAFIPGIGSSTFSAAGPLDSSAAAGSQFITITGELGNTSNTPVTYLPLGTDGAVCWLINTLETQFTTPVSVTGTSDWTMEAVTTDETDVKGVVLENNATLTATADGTANNNGAATSNGAVAHLHVTAWSGLTSDDIIIEGSATGAFGGEETTIVTFTQVTGLTSQRVEVTGTVPQYLRVADTIVGTGSITRTVAISRR